MSRFSCLLALTNGVLSAQESQPAAEPFVRVLPGYSRPWPAEKEPLWVVTADPFLFSASAAYAQDTLEGMALLLRILFETRQCLERSDWARARPAEWQQVHAPIQDLIDVWEKDERDPELRFTDCLEGALKALRRLSTGPLWQDPPFPPEALDQAVRTRWLQFRHLATALWGDTRSGSDGWFHWAAAAGKDDRPAGPHGLLPRVDHLLADPAASVPELGAASVFATAERSQAFLLRELARLQTDRAQQPSVRHALYRCLTCLLEEPTRMSQVLAQNADDPAAGVLASRQWQDLRVESGAGLTVRVNPPEHHSAELWRAPGLSPAVPNRCTVVVMISPAMRAALKELERAWARARSAWTACTGLPRGGFSNELLDRLFAVDAGAAYGRGSRWTSPTRRSVRVSCDGRSRQERGSLSSSPSRSRTLPAAIPRRPALVPGSASVPSTCAPSSSVSASMGNGAGAGAPWSAASS